jgi:nucleoside-diphosphate-sugar epimerase
MSQQVIMVTGAAGFLGSAITVDLARDHKVIALDWRKPSSTLLDSAPDAVWHEADVADADAVTSVFERTRKSLGRVDFVVHLAAFYHFGRDRRREYETTNVRGTAHVLRAATQNGAQRVIFASSVAAMQPPPPGEMLTERTPSVDCIPIPYAESKSVGEAMVRESSSRLPGVVLRIGGVFSDWSELPPLSSLIKLWAGRSSLSRFIVGRGTTGIPYIHRDDVVRITRACIDAHEVLKPYEVLLASQHGTVLHEQLFPIVHRAKAPAIPPRPISIAPRTARIGLLIKHALGCFTGNVPFERPWMLEYVDRPWVVDTTYTRRKLGWSCAVGMGVVDRLPTMVEHFKRDRCTWEHRNRLRNEGRYAYWSSES